jgi:hypothetical protein
MPLLFINFLEGKYQVTKRVRIEMDQVRDLKKILKKFGLEGHEIEIRGDGISYMVDGTTFYLDDPTKFEEINKQIDLLIK